jgi:hypothetical protein
MTTYSALVYPLTQPGQPYSRPDTPPTFGNLYGVSPTWNPYSANDVDRTEYWEDTAGTLTESQVILMLFGLTGVQNQQIEILTQAYQNAIIQPVAYTSVGGVAQTYQADLASQQNVLYSIAGSAATQTTPQGFYWVAADNTQVPFTYADLQGLAAAMLAQGAPAFARLQARKASVRNAQNVDQARMIVW